MAMFAVYCPPDVAPTEAPEALRFVPERPSLWAFLVMLLTMVGLGTLMFGLMLVIPVLGHATWHAYRDLVVREAV